jgi:phenylpropionate dioxygenase-like ring-hydroxylating dioxygenase large terminal subunit
MTTTTPPHSDIGTPLEQASALPAQYYTDPEMYRLEEEVIFRRGWIPVGRIDQVENPGDFFTFDLVGTPLIIVRGKDGVLRALSASCLHRFMPVAGGAGTRSSFQCPYHLWTYGLDGQLIGAPEMEGAEGFEIKECRLPQALLEIWEGFIFVNLDENAAPLAPQIHTLTERLAPYRLSEMRTAAILDYESDWNWKVMIENGVESYHHLGIHPDTLQPFFPAQITSHDDNDGPWIYHRIPTKDRTPLPSQFPVPDDMPADQRSELTVVSVFPLLLIALQPDEMNYMQIIPQAHDRHLVRWWICHRPDALDNPGYADKVAGSKAILDAIHKQDIDACRAVWKGVQSKYAQPGRLSHLEKGVWQFNEWMKEQIAGAS